MVARSSVGWVVVDINVSICNTLMERVSSEGIHGVFGWNQLQIKIIFEKLERI